MHTIEWMSSPFPAWLRRSPNTGLAIGGSAIALALVAGLVLAPPAGPPSRAEATIPPPPVVTTAEAAPASLSGGAVITLEGSRLEELTHVKVGGVPAEFEATDASATVVVPPSATYEAGTATLDLWDAAGRVESPDVEVVYEVQTPVDRQMAYAFAHWNDYNLEQYGNFNDWGGDCINFVSQTLVARGWQPTDDWFNDAQEDWAPAFVHVPSFDEWLRSHPEYGATTLTLDQRDQVKIGDVVLFDWDGDGSLDHAQVVSRVTTLADGSIRIGMVGHNLDSQYRDLDQALSADGQGGANATAFFWSIP
jgi:hypothetical protein